VVNFSVEQVEDLLYKTPKDSGRYNIFFKLNDKIGLKLSVSKYRRDHNYEMQSKAALKGLGPETYGCINVVYHGIKMFGYFTEIVTVRTGNRDSFYIEYDSITKLGTPKTDLRKELLEIGFDFTDDHDGNIGIKNGKLVCIDFDKLEWDKKRTSLVMFERRNEVRL
jgi:hypothetical protein